MMKSRRRGISWHQFCCRNYCKILNMNLVSIKHMKRKCGKSNQFIYFRAMCSLSPINIPIPTPASDWGGPVAWFRLFTFLWSRTTYQMPSSCFLENIDFVFKIFGECIGCIFMKCRHASFSTCSKGPNKLVLIWPGVSLSFFETVSVFPRWKIRSFRSHRHVHYFFYQSV